MAGKIKHLLVVCLASLALSSPVLAQDSIGGFFKRLVDDAKDAVSGKKGPGEDSGLRATEESSDIRLIQGALDRALRSGSAGQEFTWNNTRNGHYGAVVPLSDRFDQSGSTCRHFYRSTFSDSRPAYYQGLACEAGNGAWPIENQKTAGSSPVLIDQPDSTTRTAEAPPAAPTTPAKPATRWPSEDVFESQQLLTDLGYQPGPVDGMMGGKTRQAIRSFQRDRSLTPVGDPDRATVLALQQALYARRVSERNSVAGTSRQSAASQMQEVSPIAPVADFEPASPDQPSLNAIAPLSALGQDDAGGFSNKAIVPISGLEDGDDAPQIAAIAPLTDTSSNETP